MATPGQKMLEEAYADRKDEVAALLDALACELADVPPSVNWGHVGDLNHMAAQLKEIANNE